MILSVTMATCESVKIGFCLITQQYQHTNVQNYHIDWSFKVQLRTPISSGVILILSAVITTRESVKIGFSLINQ